MGRLKIEKFSLSAIADAVRSSDVGPARVALSFATGAAVDVSGKVRKVVKRDGKFKLVIESGDVPGFVVFADFAAGAEMLRKVKVRKNSPVAIRGRLQSFGRAAACLVGCRLVVQKTEVKMLQNVSKNGKLPRKPAVVWETGQTGHLKKSEK